MDIFIMNYGSVAAKRGGRVSVGNRAEGTEHVFPLQLVDSITLFTGTHITSGLQDWCFAHRLPVLFLNRAGGLRWLSLPKAENGVELRCRQYAWFNDSGKRLALARQVVAAKIENSRRLLLEKAGGSREEMVGRLSGARALEAPTVESLRGIEGLAGRRYFQALRLLIPSRWGFVRRVKRGCPDAVNAMLSLCYTRLYACVAAQLEFLGFDPWLGFYHEISSGHRALVSDVLEPFRADLCDRVVLSIFRRDQVKESHVRRLPGNKVRLTPEGIRLVLTAFRERLFRTRQVNDRNLTWLEIIRREGRILARALLADTIYQPWRNH